MKPACLPHSDNTRNRCTVEVMASIFTRIIAGELPGTFVYSDDLCVAFMTINPIARGHLLVVPRDEIDQWTDLPNNVSQHCFAVAKRIAEAQKQALQCERVALIIAGFEVPHCHLHVIPAATIADVSFDNAATSVDFEDLAAVAASISTALN
jgi:histidine triad (HIT) family protein